MRYDYELFKSKVIKTLNEMYMYSEEAMFLILGTCAQESLFCKYRKQINGKALGVLQIEEPTFNWLKSVYSKRFEKLKNSKFEDLEFDDELSILVCRLRYLVIPKQIPKKEDVVGLANYWKKYYNTYLGKGKVSEFIQNYNKYVSCYENFKVKQ